MAKFTPMELLAETSSDEPAPATNKNILQHVSNGRYDHTEAAIESYLRSIKSPSPKYIAELVMFMERSFKGKYLKGERSHYQRIMPSSKWRPGDTLADKLTRCKDKETFKKRFDRIGSTEILRKEHFANGQISEKNLNFNGKLYLRLMDTERNNLSIFFRNDKAVDVFISTALMHRESQQRARKQLTGSGSAKKPAWVQGEKAEVVALENPNPLQYTKEESGKNKEKHTGNSLALVHPFPFGKNQKQTPDGNYSFPQKAKLASSTSTIGSNTFQLWRNAIVETHPDECISSNATKAQIDKAAELAHRFSEFFPVSQLAEFLREVSTSWISLSKHLKEDGVWHNLGRYPELPSLVTHSDHIFTWYRKKLPKPVKPPQAAAATQEPSTKAHRPAIPLIGCDRTNGPGRTFRANAPESLEYMVATAPICNFPKHFVLTLMEQLKILSVDFSASEKRIAELEKMAEEEREQYCC